MSSVTVSIFPVYNARARCNERHTSSIYCEPGKSVSVLTSAQYPRIVDLKCKRLKYGLLLSALISCTAYALCTLECSSIERSDAQGIYSVQSTCIMYLSVN